MPNLTVTSAVDTFMQSTTEGDARDALGGLTKVVTNLAALKALTGDDLAGTVLMQGYTTAGDGGGGLFRWVAADVTTANDGTVVAPTAGGGRFLRIYDGAISVLWFGASGDGVTDDSAPVTAALATGREVVLPRGFSFVLGSVVVSDLARISGGATIIAKPGSSNNCALHVLGTDVEISGLTFAGSLGSTVNFADIKCGDGSGDIRITGCTFKSAQYSAIIGAEDGGTPYSDAVAGLSVLACTFVAGAGQYSRPLMLSSFDGILVQGCTFRDTGADAIRLRENIGNAQIIGNRFYNIGNGTHDSQTRDAVDTFWGGQDLIIQGNFVDTTASVGFDIKLVDPTGAFGSNRVVVSGNIVRSTWLSAVVIAGDSDYDGLGSYETTYGIQVSGNIIEYCSAAAGSVGDAAVVVKGLTKYVAVQDNFIFACAARGIFVHNNYTSAVANKGVIVSGNRCVNNGISGDATGSIGISVNGCDGAVISNNICENDTDLDNPYQGIGISFASVDNGYTPTRSAIITGNLCRGNLSVPFGIEGSGTRMDNVAVFRDNVIGSAESPQRAYMHQRRVMQGTAAPSSATDGNWAVGDIVLNVAPAAAAFNVGWICTTAGAPGTWMAFGPAFLTGPSTVVDVADLAANATQLVASVTVTGAALGDFVEVSCGANANGCQFWGYVSAADTVQIYQTNPTGGAINVANATYRCRVFKR